MTMPDLEATITVGIDLSPSAWPALQWAAQKAQDQRCELLVVYVDADGDSAVPTSTEPADHGRALLARAEGWLTETHPGVRLRTYRRSGRPGQVLADFSERSLLTVIGAPEHGALVDTVRGSALHELLVAAQSPVVVVPEDAGFEPMDTVVVRVDLSPVGRAAARFACEFAERTGGDVLGVHVIHPGMVYGRAADQRETELVQAWVRNLRRRHPRLLVRGEPTQGRTADALCERARCAALLVVGAPRSAVAGLAHASIAERIAHHAYCPVAIVPVEPSRAGASIAVGAQAEDA